jgi:hypothetical protein
VTNKRRAECIARAWEGFDYCVVPADVSNTQRSEMRKAFYAGAEALMTVLRHIQDGSVSEEIGVRILEAVNQELFEFCEKVKKGDIPRNDLPCLANRSSMPA